MSFVRNSKIDPLWISYNQLTEDTLALLPQIPKDVDAIVGVSRSGIFPASILAMHLHLPYFIFRRSGYLDVVDCGSGWRFLDKNIFHKDKSYDVTLKSFKHVLVVDDNSQSGTSNKITRNNIQKYCNKFTLANVYVNKRSNHKPDISTREITFPIFMEWNAFNSIYTKYKRMAFDFDGILCEDCYASDDDDGPKYLNFINNARLKYKVNRKIPLIVTARIEKYRNPTLKWLERHGMSVDKLIMHPAKTLEERRKDDIAAYKAKHFQKFCETNSNGSHWSMITSFFVESNDKQAKRIASLSSGMVICPPSNQVYYNKHSKTRLLSHYEKHITPYQKYLEDKVVSLVLPSPYLDEKDWSTAINDSDIIVGTSGMLAKNAIDNPNLGRVPDIIYHNSISFFNNESGKPGTDDVYIYSRDWWKEQKIKWLVSFLPAGEYQHDLSMLIDEINKTHIKAFVTNWNTDTRNFLKQHITNFHHDAILTSGLVTLCLLLQTRCKEIKVFGMYHPTHKTKKVANGYGEIGNYKVYRGNEEGDMTKISVNKLKNCHDLAKENHILMNLATSFNNRIKLDPLCGGLTNIQEKYPDIRVMDL